MILAGLKQNEAVVPLLWMYEVSNGLVMAHRRKRLSLENVSEIVASLKSLPDFQSTLDLPALALKYHLTAYDAAYL